MGELTSNEIMIKEWFLLPLSKDMCRMDIMSIMAIEHALDIPENSLYYFLRGYQNRRLKNHADKVMEFINDFNSF